MESHMMEEWRSLEVDVEVDRVLVGSVVGLKE